MRFYCFLFALSLGTSAFGASAYRLPSPLETLEACSKAEDPATVSSLVDQLMTNLRYLDLDQLRQLQTEYVGIRKLLIQDMVHRLKPEFAPRLETPEGRTAAALAYYVVILGSAVIVDDEEMRVADQAVKHLWFALWGIASSKLSIHGDDFYDACTREVGIISNQIVKARGNPPLLRAIINLESIYWVSSSLKAKQIRTNAYTAALRHAPIGLDVISKIRADTESVSSNPYIVGVRGVLLGSLL